MGNFRFKLSSMIPNAWFYKLKDMSKTKNQPTKKNPSKHQNSKLFEPNQDYFYYTIETNNLEKHYNSPNNPKISDTQFPEPSRKSSKKTRRKTIYKPSPTSCSAFIEPDQIHAITHSVSSAYSSPELDFVKSSPSVFEAPSEWASSCNCRISSSTADIIIDMNEAPFRAKLEKADDFCEFPELNLPPIQTKVPNSNHATEFRDFRCNNNNNSSGMVDIMMKIKKEKSMIPVLPRKSISQSTGVKVRTKTPKLASKKFQNKPRKSISLEKHSRTQKKKTFSDSFAVVKASVDPEKDFRDSMMEMVVENNMKTSKELEDLLACFLSLNSDEYHDFIIKAFEQIWFSMSEIHL